MDSIGMYQGQVIIISHANSNKGRKLSEQYLQLGARIILVDEDKHGLSKLVSSLRFAFPDSIGSCLAIRADFSEIDGYDKVVSLANTLFGEVDRIIDGTDSSLSEAASGRSESFHRRPDSLTFGKIAS